MARTGSRPVAGRPLWCLGNTLIDLVMIRFTKKAATSAQPGAFVDVALALGRRQPRGGANAGEVYGASSPKTD